MTKLFNFPTKLPCCCSSLLVLTPGAVVSEGARDVFLPLLAELTFVPSLIAVWLSSSSAAGDPDLSLASAKEALSGVVAALEVGVLLVSDLTRIRSACSKTSCVIIASV